jgi:hypothetical protein
MVKPNAPEAHKSPSAYTLHKCVNSKVYPLNQVSLFISADPWKRNGMIFAFFYLEMTGFRFLSTNIYLCASGARNYPANPVDPVEKAFFR